MQIQAINSKKLNTRLKTKTQNQPTFRATVPQLKNTVCKMPIHEGNVTKAKFFLHLTQFFTELEKKAKNVPEAPKTFVYNLKRHDNILPAHLKHIAISDGSTLAEIDEVLKSPSPFPGSHKSIGEYASHVLKIFGVKNPDFIKITK